MRQNVMSGITMVMSRDARGLEKTEHERAGGERTRLEEWNDAGAGRFVS